MVCKGFSKSLQASEHLLSILKQAAQDEMENNASGESSLCASKPSSVCPRELLAERCRLGRARRLGIRCAVPISMMEADTAFIAHTRAANDLLGARQLAACEALLDWATSAATSAASDGKHGQHGIGFYKRTHRDQGAALSRQTLAKWGLS
eukprot:COSAG02_NODE_28886_length_580_cov_0.941788_1_plen_150_part_10